jgi:hypothetical protein
VTPEFNIEDVSCISQQDALAQLALWAVSRTLQDKDRTIQEQAKQIREFKETIAEQGYSIQVLEARLSCERLPAVCSCGGLTFDVNCRRCRRDLPYEAV